MYCKSCGAPLNDSIPYLSIKCEYCGTISREIDESKYTGINHNPYLQNTHSCGLIFTKKYSC